MTLDFLTDFASIFLLLGLVATATLGWGVCLARLCGLRSSRFEIEHIWLGLCVLLALTTLVNYLVALDWKIFLGLTAIGFVLLLISLVRRDSKPQQTLTMDNRGFLSLSRAIWIVLALVSCVLAIKVMESPRNYDSGLYHFNSIRWLNEYPIVAGMGLLHDRLAFNSSWFEFPALLNIYPYFGHGYSIAALFLFLVATAQIFSFRHDQFRVARLPVVVLLVGLIPFVFDLSAPTPDAAIGIFQIVVTLLLIELSFASRHGEDALRDLKIFTIILLCVTMVTFKLSGLVFAALSVMVLAYIFYRILTVKKAVGYTLLAAVILVPHLLRGYFLSGAPLFPSTVGAILSFDWAMSQGDIESTANWVYCWARKPGEGCMESLQNWDWLPAWWEQFSLNTKALLGGSLVLILGSFMVRNRARTSEGLVFLYLCCIVNMLAIAFWFFTAPAERFLGAISYTFFAVSLLAFLLALNTRFSGCLYQCDAALRLSVVSVFVFLVYQKSLGSFTSLSGLLSGGSQPLKTVELIKRVTNNGLVVYQPASGDRCFDSPLPCTAYFEKNLQFIERPFTFPFYKFTIQSFQSAEKVSTEK